MSSTTRTEDDLKALVTRFHDEVWENGNFDVLEELLAADYVEHNPAIPYEVRGREAYRENVEMFRTAFPDLTFEQEDVLVDGEKVVTRQTVSGMHEGPFMDADPTGETVEASGIAIWRIEDGQISETWVQADILGMMQQIGLVPEMGPEGE